MKRFYTDCTNLLRFIFYFEIEIVIAFDIEIAIDIY